MIKLSLECPDEQFMEMHYYLFQVSAMDITSTLFIRAHIAEGETRENAILYTGETKWIGEIKNFCINESERYLSASREGILTEYRKKIDDVEPKSKELDLIDLEKSMASLQKRGLLKDKDFIEILEQRKILDEKRDTLSQYEGKVIVVCGGEIFVGENLNEAVTKARAKYKERPYYAKSIGRKDFPSYIKGDFFI
jgi:hypothetical protein